MRVTLQTDGGFAVFPGLQRPFSIHTTDLAKRDAEVLEQLVADAVARHQANAHTDAGADQMTYTIEITDDRNRRTILRATDPVHDPAVRALIDRLSELRATQ
jgi:hypothetical protein